MRPSFNLVAILDTIGFDLADPKSRALQVRFAKCQVYDDGTVERQYNGDLKMIHVVTIEPTDDIDLMMAVECAQLMWMGYDPPTRAEIERIKAHCAVEWSAPAEPLQIEASAAVPMDVELVPSKRHYSS